MTNVLKKRTDKGDIFNKLINLSNEISLAKKLYPRAFAEILKNESDIELGLYWRHREKRLKMESLKKLSIAQLEVDLIKIEQCV